MKKSIALLLLLLGNCASAAEPAAEPACQGEQWHQFDFWVGKWQSKSNDGKVQGFNKIHHILGNCAIQENWQSVSGKYQGTSFSFYDESRDQWHQTWVDNTGGSLYLNGEFTDGQMVLTGINRTVDSQQNKVSQLSRIAWTPLDDGRVRQYWQTSIDGGDTWEVAFDGYYESAKEE